MARPDLFTIGHSNHPYEWFLELVRAHGVEAVADVRSRPFSRFVPHFAKERLERLLAEDGIEYVFLGRELGGKPVRGEIEPVPTSYEARIAKASFRAGIARLLELAGRRRTALLCRERDPLDCHRLHLVCRYLRPRVGEIAHILPDGRSEPQSGTERRLLERAGAAALPLFGKGEPTADDATLARAYDAVWWQRR
jgi:uncharacterized protein (DUF488 family)